MMRKLHFRKILLVLCSLCLIAFSASSALAIDPYDGIGVKNENGLYFVGRFENVGEMLKNIFSEENLAMLGSVLPKKDMDNVNMIAALASNVPVKSIAYGLGLDASLSPDVQVLIAVPDGKDKLDLVASGKAKAEDIITLVLGEGGLMLAPALGTLTVQNGDFGAYYLSDNGMALAAKDDLLLLSVTSAGLQKAFAALDSDKERFSMKRQFDDPDFVLVNFDMHSLVEITKKQGSAQDIKGLEAILKQYKAPLKMEVDFKNTSDKFLLSLWCNTMEAITIFERFQDRDPLKEEDLFAIGSGKALLAGVMPILFKADDFAEYPGFAENWNNITNGLASVGITEEDVENLLNGTISLVVGPEALAMGSPIPGAYVAVAGQNGAALKIFNKLLENENLKETIPFTPVKAEGWDGLVTVDASLSPVSVMAGVKGETLVLALLDPATVAQKPEFPAEFMQVVKKDFWGGYFIDTASIWERLRSEFGDEKSLFNTMLVGSGQVPAELLAMINGVLEADVSVSFMKAWAPEDFEHVFMDFNKVDVPVEKRILPKILQIVNPKNTSQPVSQDSVPAAK